MNIFYLSTTPQQAARDHLDKHVVKMILEYAQILSTAHRVLDGKQETILSDSGRRQKVYTLSDSRNVDLYKATHTNHPSAVWARQTACNYEWLYKLFTETCDEYTYRYGRIHLTDSKLRGVLKHHPNSIGKSIAWTCPTPAMPDECRISGDSLASYRKYYIDKKADMAKWTNREPPEWFINGIKEKDAYVCLPVQEVRALFRRESKNC